MIAGEALEAREESPLMSVARPESRSGLGFRSFMELGPVHNLDRLFAVFAQNLKMNQGSNWMCFSVCGLLIFCDPTRMRKKKWKLKPKAKIEFWIKILFFKKKIIYIYI